MTRRTVVTAIVVVSVGYGVGAFLRSQADDAAPTPSATASARTGKIPYVEFSSREAARESIGAAAAASAKSVVVERAKLGGARLHAGVAANCKGDKQCQYSNCSRECNDWIGKAFERHEIAHTNTSQRVFIECVGYCLDPLEYASRVAGDAN